METFFKVSGGILIALVFYLILTKEGKDISLLLTVAVCAMVILAAVQFIKPLITLIEQLQSMGNLDNQMLEILLKSVGIALVSEVVGHICSDAGNGAMAKSVQLFSSGVILYLCVRTQKKRGRLRFLRLTQP